VIDLQFDHDYKSNTPTSHLHFLEFKKKKLMTGS
jgi:hypothetical protein